MERLSETIRNDIPVSSEGGADGVADGANDEAGGGAAGVAARVADGAADGAAGGADGVAARAADGSAAAAGDGRTRRADALRNQIALVTAARTVFLSAGVDAPAKQVADAAGVGVGTLYRHFPRRADLVTAVFRAEIDACAETAEPLLAAHPPRVALELWAQRFKAFSVAKHGLLDSLDSPSPALQGMPDYAEAQFSAALELLLDAGLAAGEIRSAISPRELFYALARLYRPIDAADPDAGDRLVAILLEGLRAMPDSP